MKCAEEKAIVFGGVRLAPERVEPAVSTDGVNLPETWPGARRQRSWERALAAPGDERSDSPREQCDALLRENLLEALELDWLRDGGERRTRPKGLR